MKDQMAMTSSFTAACQAPIGPLSTHSHCFLCRSSIKHPLYPPRINCRKACC